MKNVDIAEVGVDELKRLYIIPVHESFPHIYRVGTEINWDTYKKCLLSPTPRDWSYLQWYNQIVTAVKDEYRIALFLTFNTKWVNIAPELKQSILNTVNL